MCLIYRVVSVWLLSCLAVYGGRIAAGLFRVSLTTVSVLESADTQRIFGGGRSRRPTIFAGLLDTVPCVAVKERKKKSSSGGSRRPTRREKGPA